MFFFKQLSSLSWLACQTHFLSQKQQQLFSHRHTLKPVLPDSFLQTNYMNDITGDGPMRKKELLLKAYQLLSEIHLAFRKQLQSVFPVNLLLLQAISFSSFVFVINSWTKAHISCHRHLWHHGQCQKQNQTTVHRNVLLQISI